MFKRNLVAVAALVATAIVFASIAGTAFAAGSDSPPHPDYPNVQVRIKNKTNRQLVLNRFQTNGVISKWPNNPLAPGKSTTAEFEVAADAKSVDFSLEYIDMADPDTWFQVNSGCRSGEEFETSSSGINRRGLYARVTSVQLTAARTAVTVDVTNN